MPISLPSKQDELRHGIVVLCTGPSAEMSAKGASMDDLARWFAGYSEVGGRPVVSQTVLSGLYDFTLHWTRQSLAVNAQPSSSDAANGDAHRCSQHCSTN